MKVIYHHIKTPISYWCRQELNPKFQTLPVELTETYE